MVDEILEFLVGRAPSGVGLLADPVDRPQFAKRLGDRSNASRALIDSVHVWTPSRGNSDCLAPLVLIAIWERCHVEGIVVPVIGKDMIDR